MPMYRNKTVITCKPFYNLLLSLNNLYIHTHIHNYEYHTISLNVKYMSFENTSLNGFSKWLYQK